MRQATLSLEENELAATGAPPDSVGTPRDAAFTQNDTTLADKAAVVPVPPELPTPEISPLIHEPHRDVQRRAGKSKR